MFYHERSQPIDKNPSRYIFGIQRLIMLIKMYACRFCEIFITKIQTKPQFLLKTPLFKQVNSSPWSLWFKYIQNTMDRVAFLVLLWLYHWNQAVFVFYLTTTAQGPTVESRYNLFLNVIVLRLGFKTWKDSLEYWYMCL